MNLPDVKVVKKRNRQGDLVEYYYRRSTGVRIEGKPGSLAFKLNYERAGCDALPQAKAGAPKGELYALAEQYLRGVESSRVAASTMADRAFYIVRIQDEFGHLSLAQIQDDRVCQEFYSWRDSMAKTPVKADRAIRTLKALLNWARKRKIVKVNQADDIEPLVDSKERMRRNRSKLIWTDAQIVSFLKICNTPCRHGLQLALYTGARVGDLCRLRWDMIVDNWLVYKPSKTQYTTGVEVHLPVLELPPLRRLLESIPRKEHGFILSGARGDVLLRRNLQNTFLEYREKVPGLNLHWHDLRGSTVTRLIAAGCTHTEAAAISGHGLGTALGKADSFARYVAADRDLARTAYKKWAASGFDGFPEFEKP